MNMNPYYPSEMAQAVALNQYDRQVEEVLVLINSLIETKQLAPAYGHQLFSMVQGLNVKDTNIMKYRVTIPTNVPKTTTNSRQQLVGVPDLGEAEHYIMTPEEFDSWLEVWKADGATGQFAIIEQLAR